MIFEIQRKHKEKNLNKKAAFKMAKRKQKFKGGNKNKKTAAATYMSIKVGLKRILRKTANTAIILAEIGRRSVSAAILSVLASLLILFEVNKAVDSEYEEEFFNQNVSTYIQTRFRSVSEGRNLEQNHVYQTFIGWMNLYGIHKPDVRGWGNCFVYNYEQYETNWETNIKMHAKKRFERYFKALDDIFTKKQIKDTSTFMFNVTSRVYPNEDLLNILHALVPPDPNDNIPEENYDNSDSEQSEESDQSENEARRPVVNFFQGYHRGFFKRKLNASWFSVIPIFIRIQRIVDRFNMEREAERREEQQQRQEQQQQRQEQPRDASRNYDAPKRKKRSRKVNKVSSFYCLVFGFLNFANLQFCFFTSKMVKKKMRRRNKKKRMMLRNFAVVPICSYRRRHLRYDSQAIYNLFGNLGILPTDRYGKNIPVNRFTSPATRRNSLNTEFNLNFLSWLGDPTGRRRKRYEYTFTTDGVACSPLYEKSTKNHDPEEMKTEYAKRYLTMKSFKNFK